MSSPPRDRWYTSSFAASSLRAEMRLSADELAAAAGITRQRLDRLVRLGLVEPTASGASDFSAETAARLRRMVRLHADLGVSFVAASIIVELLERVERAEAALRAAREHS